MKKANIIFLLIFLAIIVLTFVLHPYTNQYAEYKSIFTSNESLDPILGTAHYYFASAKALLMAGVFDFAYKTFLKGLMMPGGMLQVILYIYFLSLVLWVYISWRVGKKKGKPGIGILLGLILGIIGLIIVLLLPEDEKHQESEKLKSGEYTKCPYCAELVKREAKICKHCGKSLESTTLP